MKGVLTMWDGNKTLEYAKEIPASEVYAIMCAEIEKAKRREQSEEQKQASNGL